VTIIEGRRLPGHLETSADVVVVGSGAGGAVVAAELAAAGLEVVVLEEGPHVPGEVQGRLRPTESMRTLWREAGTTAVLGLGDTPLISVLAGRGVGGSSLLTGGVCFRVPSSVHRRWVDELGLPMLSERELEPAFEAVERMSGVETVPESMRSLSTRRFVDGASRLGIPMQPIRRNTRGCCGCGRCNFGCPHGAKLSVDRTYLPKARAAGARIYADALVDEVLSLGGRVRGVRGRLLGGAPDRQLFVRAPWVVVAAGSLHTPLLLMRSGLRAAALGRNLTLHPAFRVVAAFDERLDGWKGALQSAYSDHFEADGITLTGLFVPPNVLAAGLPGVGPDYARRVADIGRAAIFGGMVHDDGGGRVRRGPGREPVITYRMSPRNKASAIRCVEILAECFLEGGAREVYLPIFGSSPVRGRADLRRALHPGLPARRLECITFHPLGTARISIDPAHGVVDPWGHSHELEGLVVADGSVVPTSIGVNSQLTVMAMATRIAGRLRDRLRDRAVGPGAVRVPAAAHR
jgi:choline dehydrogenase-like flavoprotein